jgi:hypothetical protein
MFQVESLEGKQLLSAMHAAHHAAPNAPALVLDGDLKDKNTANDAEQFSGHVKGMGAVRGTVMVNYTGPNSPTDAEVVLTNSRGSVTLVAGPNDVLSVADNANNQVNTYRFTVQSGTGAYARASGAGTFTWTVDTADWVTSPADLKLHTTRPR